MTGDDIATFGGEACARELADIFAAGERYAAARGLQPDGLDEPRRRPRRAVVLWMFDPDARHWRPADGSPCPDAFPRPATPAP